MKKLAGTAKAKESKPKDELYLWNRHNQTVMPYCSDQIIEPSMTLIQIGVGKDGTIWVRPIEPKDIHKEPEPLEEGV